MSQNLILPSTNNLVASGGNNLRLTTRVSKSSRGGYRTLEAIPRTVIGRYAVRHPKDLRVTGGNLILPSGNNAVLGTLRFYRSVQGQHQIFTQVAFAKGQGQYKIFAGLERGAIGYSRIGYERFTLMARKGVYLVFRGTSAAKKGVTNIRGIFTSKQRGYHLIYENYKPITKHGRYFIFEDIDKTNKGRHRVENDSVEGFVVYVGYDEMPDFMKDPDGFSATRPVVFSITPPVSGTSDLNVVLRTRNKQGLESGNTKPKVITVDTNGDEVLGPISAPILTDVVTSEDEYFRMFIRYPGIDTDANPGDIFKVYVGQGAPPVPGVDTPVTTGPTSLDAQVLIGPYPTGSTTYYFAVTVFRNQDNEESEAATASIVLGDDPLTPVAVKGGFDVRE